MRLLLPLLFTFFFLGTLAEKAFAQNCQTPIVTLPADMSYCGSRTIAFNSANADHKPSYSGTIATYSWSIDGVVKATNSYPTFSFPEGHTYQISITVTNNCGSATATQAITVEARPNPPVVENGGMCTGAEGTLWVTSLNPNLIYKWYNVSSGGSALVWGDTFTTSTPGDYYVEALTKAGCTSSTRTKATLTASSPTGNGGGISISNQQICSGTSPSTMSGNAPNSSFMTYQWYQSTTGSDSDFYPLSSAKGKDYTPSALSQTTWFKRIAYNGFCGQESNVIKVTVIPRPEAPDVNDVVVCYDIQAVFNVANADQNTVYKWYASATSSTSIGTGPTFTTPQPLKTSTSFYVEASTTTNSACYFTTPRTEVRAEVTPPITGNTITADQSLCSGGTPYPLEGSVPQGGSESYIYQWQRSENGSGFTDIPGANARDFAPGSLSTTTWYRRKVSSANSCPEVTSNIVRISVAPLPVSINIAEPVTSCAGSGTTITITNADPAAYTYRWYDVATGGSILGTGSSFATGPLTSDKTYYVEATTAAGCISNRRPVTVTVTTPPARPIAGGVTVCAGSSATLAVNPTDATLFYRWYNSTGAILATGTSYPTGPVSENTTFYVEAVTKASPGCTSPREPVTVTVLQPISDNTITAGQVLCYGETPAVLQGNIPEGGGGGYTYQWQSSEDGTLFTDITGATGVNYAPQMLRTSARFRRMAGTISATCPAAASNIIKIEVNQLPVVPAIPGKTICTGTTATLQIPTPDAGLTYKWYTVATGGIPVATDISSFTTETLTSNKTYYVEAVTRSGCISTTRRPVTVTVIQLPPVPAADNVTICAGSTATLAILAPNPDLTYQWFDAAQGGTLLATGTSMTTTPLTGSTTYYVQAVTNTDCASPARKAVAVTVIPLPAIPDVAGATICSGSSTTLYVNNPEPGVIYRWYSGSTLLATGTSFPTGNLSSGASYYLDAITNNAAACASPGGRTVVVNVIPPITNNTVTASQTICSGSIPVTLNGTVPAGGSGTPTYQWEKSGDGVNFTSIAGATNSTYTSDALATTTWYRRRVKGTDACPDNASNVVQITVNALPATPVADAATICTGTTAPLSVNAPVTGLTYKWYSAATGGRILSTASSFTTDNLEATTTFYVEATNASGCISARRAVTVTVTPVPDAPLVADKTICVGGQAVLAVSAADQSLVYRWYNSDGDLVATGATYTTETLNSSATYYAEAATTTTPACVSNRSAVRVTVTPLPAMPVVANASVCAGGAAELVIQLIDPTLTYKWYTSATGGTAFATGTTYNTGTLTSGRTYYAEASTASGCASPRASIRVDVTPLPASPNASNVNVCAGQTATLAVSGPDANLSYRWYDAATDGNLLATGDTYTTGPLSAGATYFVEAVTAAGCASNSRRAVTVNVTPLPAAPEADNVTICAGGSTTLWVKNQEPNVIYNWYSGGALAGTGISFTTGNLSNSTTYYLEAVTDNSTACASSSRSAVVVTVTPAVANNFINASQRICSGSTPATLTGSLPNGGGGNYSYQWERSEDGINFTAIANATNQNYTPDALNITTWFRRKVRAAGPCAESISSAVQITTSPIPATPVADDITICEGATATLGIKDANAAYTYRWYTTPVGGNAVFANTSYTTRPLESTTTFYVEAVNASGCVSPRRTVTVSVMPLPEAPMAADQNICAGEQATLAVSNQAPNLTYSWYNGNGDLLATGTTFTTPEPLNSNTTFYVEASSSATPSCTSGRTAVAVNVAARPATPLADDVSICAGSAAGLAVKGIIPGLTYRWYTVATGGLPVHTGSNYSTAALTTGRTYYVEAATASACTSISRKAVVVSVIQPPAAPMAADKTICAGQQVTLTVSNPDVSLLYHWYDQSGGPLATGNTYTTTTAPAASTTFYVVAATMTSPSCTGPREAIAVTVTPLPAKPEVEEATVCTGSTATLWISNVMPSTIYKWYDESDALQGTGPSFTTPALAASTTYFVAAETANGCASATRQTATVNVVQPIANNAVSAAQTVCYGGSPAMLTGSQPLGGNLNYTYQWESSEDGINFRSIANATGKDYTPGALTATTWFRRSASAGSTCSASTSDAVKITVIPLPAMLFVANTTVCAGANAILTVTSPDTDLTYRWYATATGGGSIATGDSFTATSVSTTITYFVEAVNASGCNSARRAVTVYVVPLPEVPQAADKSICAGELTTLSVISPDARLVYNWYDANGLLQQTSSSFTTPTLNRTTLYYVEATTTEQSCPGPRKAVRVSVTQQPATPLVDNVTVCAGSAASMAVKNYDPSLTYKWYTAAAGDVVLATGPTFNTTNLTSDRIYYVEAGTANGCLSDRTAVAVDVTPLPALPVVSNQAICAGETATFTVADEKVGLTYRWYDAPLGGTLLATGNTFTTGNLNRSSTYYVEAVTPGGCVSLSRRPAVATVSPLPAAPAVENASICSGESVTLWVKNPDPALEYKWYSDAAATDQIGSGISYTSPAILANQHYFVKAVNSNNCASPALKQVDVTVISKPGAPLVEDAIVCAGGNAMLSVSAPDPTVVYKWYNVNGSLLHNGTTYTTAALTSNTTYAVTAYAAASQTCASASQVVTVTVIPAITDNEVSDDQAICYNSAPAKLTGTFPAGGGNNLLYQWERSQDGVIFTGITGGNAQDYTSGTLTVTTWFRRKVRTAGPCPESISNVVKITVSPSPNAPLADNATTCAGSSAILTVKNAQSGLTYSWYDAANGGTFLGTGISYTTDALTMNSTFYVEATNAPGCTSSSRRAVFVSVVSAVGNNVIRDVPPVCYGETPEKLTGTPPTGTSNGYTYQWQRSENGVKFLDIPGATAQNYTPTEAYTRTTWFRRKVVTTGPCPESYSNLVKLEVVPLPVTPVAASVEVCPGSSAILSATAASGEMLEWYDAPAGGNLLHQGGTYTTPALNTSAVYFVQALNSTGCISSERREVKADVVVPQAKVSGDASIFYGKAVRLTAEGGIAYKWYPETSLSDPASASPMASPKETTTYTVTVTTAGGCTATNQLTVAVSPKVEPANAITPNGDGYNDVFQIKNLEAYENCTVQIFSRWGEMVFESRGYTTPWDGTKKGQPLPTGAYYYIIRLNSTEPPISGSVTLVK